LTIRHFREKCKKRIHALSVILQLQHYAVLTIEPSATVTYHDVMSLHFCLFLCQLFTLHLQAVSNTDKLQAGAKKNTKLAEINF